MPSDSQLRQMADNILDQVVNKLLDEAAKVVAAEPNDLEDATDEVLQAMVKSSPLVNPAPEDVAASQLAADVVPNTEYGDSLASLVTAHGQGGQPVTRDGRVAVSPVAVNAHVTVEKDLLPTARAAEATDTAADGGVALNAGVDDAPATLVAGGT